MAASKLLLIGAAGLAFMAVSRRPASAQGINPATGQPYAPGTSPFAAPGVSPNQIGTWLAMGKSVFDIGKPVFTDYFKDNPVRGDIGSASSGTTGGDTLDGGSTSAGGSLSDRLRDLDPWKPIDYGGDYAGDLAVDSNPWGAVADPSEGLSDVAFAAVDNVDPWAGWDSGGDFGMAGLARRTRRGLARRGWKY